MCPDTLLASGSGTQDVSVVAGDVIIWWSPRLSIYKHRILSAIL